MKKPNLNNDWGQTLSNRIRDYLNLPLGAGHENGLLNTVIGEGKYLLVLEAAGVPEIALLSLFKKVDPFSVGAHLDALLAQVSINNYLPAPVHVALKHPDSLVIMTRIHRQRANQAVQYLDLLFSVYENAAQNL